MFSIREHSFYKKREVTREVYVCIEISMGGLQRIHSLLPLRREIHILQVISCETKIYMIRYDLYDELEPK
jgi:hypothetical protein